MSHQQVRYGHSDRRSRRWQLDSQGAFAFSARGERYQKSPLADTLSRTVVDPCGRPAPTNPHDRLSRRMLQPLCERDLEIGSNLGVVILVDCIRAFKSG